MLLSTRYRHGALRICEDRQVEVEVSEASHVSSDRVDGPWLRQLLVLLKMVSSSRRCVVELNNWACLGCAQGRTRSVINCREKNRSRQRTKSWPTIPPTTTSSREKTREAARC